MAVFASPLYTQNQPANTGHGFNTSSVHMHATASVTAAMTTNDTINFGYLPANAVVVAVLLKAATQLDSNGAPTLTLSLGVTGTAALFKAAVTTVGRVSGASVDITNAAAGVLYKNVSGAKIAVIGTCANVAATPVAGTLEADIEFYAEDVVGSPS